MTAGKLLHGKRPRLIPLFDRKRISKALAEQLSAADGERPWPAAPVVSVSPRFANGTCPWHLGVVGVC